MNVSLAAHRLIAQTARCIRHHTDQQHAVLQGAAMFLAPYIHHDGINRVRTLTIGIAQAAANVVEPAKFR